MEPKTERKNDGSSISSAGNEENNSANQISDRDLKMLSLEYIGESGGTYYFRDPADPSRTYSGDREDYVTWRIAHAVHPLIDRETAAAALRMQRMAAVIEA